MLQAHLNTGRSGTGKKRGEAVVETLAFLRSEGESVAEVAHDARNMVTALGLYCDLLEEPGVLAHASVPQPVPVRRQVPGGLPAAGSIAVPAAAPVHPVTQPAPHRQPRPVLPHTRVRSTLGHDEPKHPAMPGRSGALEGEDAAPLVLFRFRRHAVRLQYRCRAARRGSSPQSINGSIDSQSVC